MPATGARIRKDCFSRLALHRLLVAGAFGVLAVSAYMPFMEKAAAQARNPIPWSLFGSSPKPEEDPVAEAAPEQEPPRPVPLPPKRPVMAVAPVPQPVAAEPVKPPEGNKRPVENPTATSFGTVYHSLGSKEFIPFSEPRQMPLRPKQIQQKSSQAGSGSPSVAPVSQENGQQRQTVAVAPQESSPVSPASASTPMPPAANAPIPPTAPVNRGHQRVSIVSTPANGQPQQIPPPPSVVASAASAQPQVSTLTERQIIDRANRFFNSTETMEADFTQIGGDGKRMTGVLYLQRPGRMRFAYNPPATMEIISDGKNVAIRDSKLNTSDVYSINQTPLKFLLRDPVDLSKDLKVIDVERSPEGVLITLEDGSTIGGKAQITLFFDQQVQNLRRWRILDAQGFVTTVNLSQVQRTRRGG